MAFSEGYPHPDGFARSGTALAYMSGIMKSILKKPFLLLSLLALLAMPKARAEATSVDSSLRFSVTPLIGLVGGWPGLGIDLSLGYGLGAFGFSLTGGSEMCFMCDRASESESQTRVLLGARKEFSAGVITFRSGIAAIERDTKDSRVSTEYGPGIRHFAGYGVPFQLDLALTGKYVGIGLSATVMADGDGGSAGLMLGIPIGLLRR
jgi:hypothetical protein